MVGSRRARESTLARIYRGSNWFSWIPETIRANEKTVLRAAGYDAVMVRQGRWMRLGLVLANLGTAALRPIGTV